MQATNSDMQSYNGIVEKVYKNHTNFIKYNEDQGKRVTNLLKKEAPELTDQNYSMVILNSYTQKTICILLFGIWGQIPLDKGQNVTLVGKLTKSKDEKIFIVKQLSKEELDIMDNSDNFFFNWFIIETHVLVSPSDIVHKMNKLYEVNSQKKANKNSPKKNDENGNQVEQTVKNKKTPKNKEFEKKAKPFVEEEAANENSSKAKVSIVKDTIFLEAYIKNETEVTKSPNSGKKMHSKESTETNQVITRSKAKQIQKNTEHIEHIDKVENKPKDFLQAYSHNEKYISPPKTKEKQISPPKTKEKYTEQKHAIFDTIENHFVTGTYSHNILDKTMNNYFTSNLKEIPKLDETITDSESNQKIKLKLYKPVIDSIKEIKRNKKTEAYNQVVECTIKYLKKYKDTTVKASYENKLNKKFNVKLIKSIKPEKLNNDIFGLDGITDSSWLVKVDNKKESIMPFEYKSGIVKKEYKYQVMFYIIMMMKNFEELFNEFQKLDKVGMVFYQNSIKVHEEFYQITPYFIYNGFLIRNFLVEDKIQRIKLKTKLSNSLTRTAMEEFEILLQHINFLSATNEPNDQDYNLFDTFVKLKRVPNVERFPR